MQKPTFVSVALCAVAIGVASCGGEGTPTSPTIGGAIGASGVLGLEVACPPSLLIGQRGPCVAAARLPSGSIPVIPFEATWSSTRPDIVAVDPAGVVVGRAAGDAVVSVGYRGHQAAVKVAVTVEDAIRIDVGQGQRGDFKPGSTVTVWLQGYYSVASADSGRLSLHISDQNGTIASTSPVTVARGGDLFVMSSTFVVPQDSVRLCRTAVLEIGPVTITAPSGDLAALWCIRIQR